MTRAKLTALLGVCMLLLASGRARADGIDLWPDTGRGALAGRVGYYEGEQLSVVQRVVVPVFAGHHAFSERWSISAEGGFVFVHSDPEQGDSDHAFGVANPAGLAFFTPWPQARHQLRFGLGGSLPMSLIARGPRGRLQRAGISNAAGMEGLGRMELWSPSRGAFLGTVQLRGPISDLSQYELQLRPALPLAIVRRVDENRTDLFVPIVAGVRSRNARLEGGIRMIAVLTPTSNVDALQLSLSPHVRLHEGDGWLGLRVVAPLDEPLSGRRGPRLWGLFLESGGSL
ncbi:MAG: hypothetical protein OXT09_03675 [Myxococcales bacterium]|nr:hypothetical protein [Myxococcales bacterium]